MPREKAHDLKSPRFAGDPVLEACYDNERLLRVGDRGPAVVKIQQALIDTGFPLPRFGADGIFGAETKVAVQNYQKAHGLSADGIIGPITMGSLDAQFAPTPLSYPPDQNFRNWFFPVMPQSPLRDGNEVTAFIQGADTFKAMVDAIRTTKNAAHFIYLLGWDLQTDFKLIQGDAGSTIEELLTKASEGPSNDGVNGVQVRAMLNFHQKKPGGGTFTGFDNKPPVDFINKLSNGAAIQDGKYLNFGSHHQKVLVVNGEQGLIAFSGGIDINHNRFLKLHDVHCRIKGPAAWDHYQIFVKRWTDNIYSNRVPINKGIPIPGKCGDKHAQVALTYGNGTNNAGIDIVPNVIPPTPKGYKFAPHGDRSAKALIRQAISNTQSFIYLEDQYLVDMSMSRALARKLPAIKFLIILIAHTNSVNGELYQGWRRRKDFIDNLVKVDPAKVIVCYHTKTLVHSKTWIFDDKFAIIGSANCNRRGYTHDSEQIVGIFHGITI
jgi:phosphatidylserine/phosphatidylglycerophosphate/cardiolipin synthase-like enzyme